MSDLSEYFSQQDRIKELECELALARGVITKERHDKSRYKILYENLKGERAPTRKEKALLLIKELKSTGKPTNLIRAIAKKCFLAEGTVNELWYKS